MDQPFLGMIAMFAFNFAPRGWAFSSGQILSIAQNTALFSLLGTMYGGNGTTTFALPDLRGRAPLGMGQGSGLSGYSQGQASGTENVTLLLSNLPAHNHIINASSDAGDTAAPANAFPANTGAYDREYKASATNAVLMNPGTVGLAGSSQPFSIIQPYLTLNYCICLSGIFPSRN